MALKHSYFVFEIIIRRKNDLAIFLKCSFRLCNKKLLNISSLYFEHTLLRKVCVLECLTSFLSIKCIKFNRLILGHYVDIKLRNIQKINKNDEMQIRFTSAQVR